jgi:hypothetical protein
MWIGSCPSVGYHLRRDALSRAAIASLLPARQPGLVQWISPTPSLMLREHILPAGAKIVFALNWTDRPQYLKVSQPTELHNIEGFRPLSANAQWETRALSGSLLRAL